MRLSRLALLVVIPGIAAGLAARAQAPARKPAVKPAAKPVAASLPKAAPAVPDAPDTPREVRAMPAARPTGAGESHPFTAAVGELHATWGTLRLSSDENGKPLGGKLVGFRIAPTTTLQRFGGIGRPEEFRPGDRVTAYLVTVPARAAARGAAARPEARYLDDLFDEISFQRLLQHSYEVVSKDEKTGRFTLQRRNFQGKVAGEPLVLGHDEQTLLMREEAPEREFHLAPGDKLWVNTAVDPKGQLVARDVLDEASMIRFEHAQALRMVARADAVGAPLVIETVGGGEMRVKFPSGYAPWLTRLRPDTAVRLGPPGSPILRVKETDEVSKVTLTGAAPGLKPGAALIAHRATDAITFNRDIRPILMTNCYYCHGLTRPAGGFQVSNHEALEKGGDHGPGIVKEKSGQSLLYLAVSGGRTPRMPPDRPLTPEQLTLIRQWIDHGASFEASPGD